MQLKYVSTLLEAQPGESRIAAIAWSPNNQRLAVATADRQILMFDEQGERRDKFSTKPTEPSAGKRSYVIKALAFSPDSTRIAVAQSDNIVFVYKIGESWGDKKAICNKFVQPCPVTCLAWLSTGPLVCGLADGKVRALQIKTNKSQSLYASDSLVVALAANPRGTAFVSAHADGALVRYHAQEEGADDGSQGRLAVHPVPAYALAWTHSHIVAAGPDKRIVVYGPNGRAGQQFDYSRDDREHEFTVACCSPSGQSFAVGSHDRLRVFSWSARRGAWEEAPAKTIAGMYSVTALAWKKDGSRLACGALCGLLHLYESVLKRTVWKDKFELTYVGASQLIIKPMQPESRSVILSSSAGQEIEDVRILGRDSYLVARTEETLLIGDLQQNLLSEVPWHSSGRREKFYFDYPTVCLVFNAGELSLIEYGENDILASVRTEFANPHLMSVRLNERPRPGAPENKKLAYLLDLKTICLMDLIGGQSIINQISHDSKIDWLELNETGERLLFRDKKQRLMMADVRDGQKICIFSGVGFVQWVPGSDVAIAQAANSLAVWYNIDLPDRPTVMQVKGEVVDITRQDGRTEAVARDSHGNETTHELDEALLEFGTAVRDGDYGRAVLYLETIGGKQEAAAMWHSLAGMALAAKDLSLAERCYAALGDVAKAFYLRETAKITEEHEVSARLAVLDGDLTAAENIYLEQGELEAALDMYKRAHRWEKAIELAERRGHPKLQHLRQEYMVMLTETGQDERAGQVLEDRGDLEQAVALYLKAGRASRAASVLMGTSSAARQLLRDNEQLLAAVLKQLIRSELFERAAELYERTEQQQLALECFRKGRAWSRAIELARSVAPERVVVLEEEWADALVQSGQQDAAISHYIEAGRTRKALDAAVAARQWAKAAHIVQVIEDVESVRNHCDTLAKHFVQVRDYATAERLFVRADRPADAVAAFISASQWERAFAVAEKHLGPQELADVFTKHARQLEEEGRLRDAERLYVSAGDPDAAIAMYKRREQYDAMVRLVERHHPDLLQTTRLHLGQQLETQGRHRAAEAHYVAAGEWRAALDMYRAAAMWEDAHRVAAAGGGAPAANQVLFLWARGLALDSSVRLLQKHSLLDACVDHACDTGQFDFAFRLAARCPEDRTADVHCRRAMALEDDGRFDEAEAEFVLAGKPREAVLMYVHSRDWASATRVAEAHVPEATPEVLAEQARHFLELGKHAEFEALMLRARRPELVLEAHKAQGRWADALRVCRDYLPDKLRSLQGEYEREQRAQGGDSLADVDSDALVARADEWAAAGRHAQAVECLLRVQDASPSVEKRALLRAAELTQRFLGEQQTTEVARRLCPRLLAAQEHAAAAQLYLAADMMREAIDCFISCEDWTRARKIARELEPAYESYVEGRYKARLKDQGDVERLADIDIVGALDLLAEQGQWARCLDKARSHAAPVLHKYVALHASQLLRDGRSLEALALYVEYGAPAVAQNLNVYARIALDVFAMPAVSDSYALWAQLRRVLHELWTGMTAESSALPEEARERVHTLLLVAHFYAVRAAARELPALGGIAARISTAMLRYTDAVPADKAFYEAGIDLRAQGREAEAFVFLNHYLDVCEAIEEGEPTLVDHSDLGNTDFPAEHPLPAELYLRDEPRTHDDIREWVLAVSMDQRVGQVLPTDDRGIYESSLLEGESPCIITGYPVSGQQPVRFQKSNLKANRDAWSKLLMAGKMSPQSNVPNILAFIEQWCGPAIPMIN